MKNLSHDKSSLSVFLAFVFSNLCSNLVLVLSSFTTKCMFFVLGKVLSKVKGFGLQKHKDKVPSQKEQ